MHEVISFLQGLVAALAELCIPLVQLVGIVILVISAAKSVAAYVRGDEHVGVKLAHGLALALEFLLGAEVLHIVLAHDWKELGILGVGVVIHILLTMLLHKEVQEGKEK
ncbi:MAG: DUF1622 domain-containing protein [Clostridiales bacterium]|nr:DUF1622 domain-containing protein [Clostridiales bacterium]